MIPREPITERAAWRGAELAADRSFAQTLDDGDRAELAAALGAVKARGLALAEVDRDAFPLARLQPRLVRIAAELRQGRGFALLHGFPVADHPWPDLELMYWGLCSHLGIGLTQNGDAGLIHYVTEGARRPSQGRRVVGFPRESYLHVDLTDVAVLLCVRQAPDDPPSRVASALNAYNEILRRRPEALDILSAGFEWDRMDEHGPGEAPTTGYAVPVFSRAADGTVSCRYNRHWITNAAGRLGRPLPPAAEAAFDLLDETLNASRFEFPFHAGDIQFCNNHVVLHGRAAHASIAEDARRRVLMRIWLDMPDIRALADEALVRCGVGRHGQVGWTAAEVRAGLNARPRARLADGRVAGEGARAAAT